MTTLISQPSAIPTRKLSAATATGVIMAVSGVVVRNLWPDWYDPDLWIAATPLVAFVVGYVIKDEPNVTPEFQGEL